MQPTKPLFESKNIPSANISALAKLFPSCITESRGEDGKLKQSVDFDKLRALLGGDIAQGDESYDFTWVGKKAAMQEAGIPVRKTLRPVVKDEVIPTGADSSGKPYCSTGSKNWDTTQNLYIEGDNLDVLKLLQESYLKKVKMIYIDPPYNTGNDFIYNDHFEMDKDEYDEGSGAVDDSGIVNFQQNNDANPRFHSDWCSMIYPRLVLARNLLTDDGVLLFSVGDRELKNSIAILDEIYGASNQVCIFVWKSRAKPTNAGNSKYRPQKIAEYVLTYSRSSPDNQIYNVISAKQRSYSHEDEKGKFRTTTILTSNRGTFRRETMRFESHGYTPDEDYRWKAGKETIDELYDSGHIFITEDGIPMEKKYEKEEIDPLYPIYCYIDSDISGTAENGKTELNNLIGNQHGFDTVKPVQLIKYFIQTVTGINDIIMDFFSGSCTTVQACFEQNSEDYGKRTVIAVQIAEPCDKRGEAYKTGYKTICDIGKKRIRLAGDKINAELKKKDDPQLSLDASDIDNSELDTGFRVFKVDDSNMKDVYYSAEETNQQMLSGLESNIKEDRTDMDLLYGCLLDWGLPLSLPYTSETLDGVTVHTVDNGALIACFDADIPESAIRMIAQRKPLRAVFRDSSFATSPEKINVTEIFKTISPNTGVKVI
jgi:adenine-specific DNA-methyltransferase